MFRFTPGCKKKSYPNIHILFRRQICLFFVNVGAQTVINWVILGIHSHLFSKRISQILCKVKQIWPCCHEPVTAFGILCNSLNSKLLVVLFSPLPLVSAVSFCPLGHSLCLNWATWCLLYTMRKCRSTKKRGIVTLGRGILWPIVVLSHFFPVAPPTFVNTCRDSVNNLWRYVVLNVLCPKLLP